MGFVTSLWDVYLFQPLVNALVYLYNTNAHQNLGWAVVYLTIALRVVLLPFSILSERNQLRYAEMQEKIDAAERVHRTDPVYLKQYVRGLAKQYRVRPWAKTIVLAFQLLVLVLLYQVFVTGISGAQLARILYPGIEYPGKLDTLFFTVQYGSVPYQSMVFDIGERSLLWAALVAVVLLLDILIGVKRGTRAFVKSDLTFLILFPLASFLILWWLPMVKALFIFTSLMFGYALTIVRVMFYRPKKTEHH